MTILPKPNDDGGERSSLKKRPLPSVSSSEEEDSSSDEVEESNSRISKKQYVPPVSSSSLSSEEEESSSSGEEFQNDPSESVLQKLSNDESDSSEEKEFAELLRSRRPKRFPSPKPLTLPDPDVLDCPNCFQRLTKPIFQCKTGHVACSSCCTKLKNKCSFCALPIGDIRCRVMEKVLKTCLVACSYAKYGCKKSTTFGKKEADHKKLCVFAPCFCPVRNCNYIGYYKDLNNHCRARHQQSRSEIMPFVFNSPPQIFGMEHNDVIFQEEKEGDLIVVQGFRGSNGMYVTVKRIAPLVPEVARLTCSIAYVQEDSTLKLEFLVKHVQLVGEQKEQPGHSFMLIPSHMLSGRHLKMHICIGNEQKSVRI